jgi:hypothetical protein
MMFGIAWSSYKTNGDGIHVLSYIKSCGMTM